jgi:hypothetical protein
MLEPYVRAMARKGVFQVSGKKPAFNMEEANEKTFIEIFIKA